MQNEIFMSGLFYHVKPIGKIFDCLKGTEVCVCAELSDGMKIFAGTFYGVSPGGLIIIENKEGSDFNSFIWFSSDELKNVYFERKIEEVTHDTIRAIIPISNN